MPEYSYLPFDDLLTFEEVGDAGKKEIDFVRGDDALGIVAKSLYIENVAQLGTITVELSSDGSTIGRRILLGPGQSRNYGIEDRVRIWKVKASCTVIGGQLAIGATPGEWTDDEWNAYLIKMGVILSTTMP